jgi:hypothetical protein
MMIIKSKAVRGKKLGAAPAYTRCVSRACFSLLLLPRRRPHSVISAAPHTHAVGVAARNKLKSKRFKSKQFRGHCGKGKAGRTGKGAARMLILILNEYV